MAGYITNASEGQLSLLFLNFVEVDLPVNAPAVLKQNMGGHSAIVKSNKEVGTAIQLKWKCRLTLDSFNSFPHSPARCSLAYHSQ